MQRLIARTLTEAKRKKRGPVYHLLARMSELDDEIARYKRVQLKRDALTYDHASGMRTALVFSVALVMKYRHSTPGLNRDEIDLVLDRLKRAKTFEKVASEPLPVAA
jgi:hypothetical protein